MLFGPWFGISVPSRVALPRKCALAATRDSCLAVAQLVMPNRKVQLLQITPWPYVHNLHMVCGYPGWFSQSLPLACFSPGLVGKRQGLAAVHLQCLNSKSDTSWKRQTSHECGCLCWNSCVIEAVRWLGLSSLWWVMSSAQLKLFDPSVLSNKHDCNSQLFHNQGKRREMSVFVVSATWEAALWGMNIKP